MRDQHSSLVRQTLTHNLDHFVQFLCLHGALGYGFDPVRAQGELSEEQLLGILPLFFGLVPADALARPTQVGIPRIRPLIADYLNLLGIEGDQLLEDVLVAIANQYRNTEGAKYLLTGVAKLGIRDIRARRRPYRLLVTRQNGRCACCGAAFSEVEETLDHIVPWQFVGDINDGSNWQLLCLPCNAGKGVIVSTLQSPFAYNWIYGSSIRKIHQTSRYIALRRSKHCGHEGCRNTPRDAKLFAVLIDAKAVPVVDYLAVRCEKHVTDVISDESEEDS